MSAQARLLTQTIVPPHSLSLPKVYFLNVLYNRDGHKCASHKIPPKFARQLFQKSRSLEKLKCNQCRQEKKIHMYLIFSSHFIDKSLKTFHQKSELAFKANPVLHCTSSPELPNINHCSVIYNKPRSCHCIHTHTKIINCVLAL